MAADLVPSSPPPYAAPAGMSWTVVQTSAGAAWSLAASPVPAAPAKAKAAVWPWLLILPLMAVAGWFAWERYSTPKPPPPPAPRGDGAALAKAYRPDQETAYGQAWVDGAAAYASGKPLADVLTGIADEFEKGRKAAFNAKIAPEFSKIVPAGKDDKDVSASDRLELSGVMKAYGAEFVSGGKAK